MDFYQKWSELIFNSESDNIDETVIAEGVFERPSGSRMHYAKIIFEVSPNRCFEVDMQSFEGAEAETKDYMEWGIYGLLDEFLAGFGKPLRNVRVKIIDMVIHPVNSSKYAFRCAGRNAAKNMPYKIKGF